MPPQTEKKIVLVVRPSRLDDLIRRFNSEAQAKFYIEHLGADFSDYRREHDTYQQAREQVSRQLAVHGRLHVVDRSFLPNYLFGPGDLVAVLGQDGLVANVIKYLDGQPVIGINPDPERYEGTLLPFNAGMLAKLMPQVLHNDRPTARITMAQVRLNTGQTLHAVNDLFIGPKTHSSARYRIETGGRAENHSSSGVIVSTGLGSTGWLRSIVAGATGIAAQVAALGKAAAPPPARIPAAGLRLPWDAPELIFSVREPWPSKATAATITCGRVTRQSPLLLQSQMPENGVIFSDGIELDFLDFNAGTAATITPADKQGCLVK